MNSVELFSMPDVGGGIRAWRLVEGRQIVEKVSSLFDVPLRFLHKTAGFKSPEHLLRVREDQQTSFHERFYAAWQSDEQLRLLYRGLVDHVRRKWDEPMLYQTVPTFRVQLPGNVAVGEFHRDGDYGHPEGETVCWLGLTDAVGTRAVHFEKDDGSRVPVDVLAGEFWLGNTRDHRHGNLPNETIYTRVSFDFRLLPHRLYTPTQAGRSVARGLRFVLGEYWSM